MTLCLRSEKDMKTFKWIKLRRQNQRTIS